MTLAQAVMNEKFGDGIMSAINFSTKVEKETEKDGTEYCKITLRGKCKCFSFDISRWTTNILIGLPYSRF